MRLRIYGTLLDWLHSFCKHPPEHVVADLCEGEQGSASLAWCRVCGSYCWRIDVGNGVIMPVGSSWVRAGRGW